MTTRLGLLVAVGAAAIYLFCVVGQLDRPLMYDDANFALGARAVAETGLPFGNQGWMSDRGDFSHREQWALWHPPLYIYADGLLARIGGWTPPVLRLLGLIGGLATGVLTWLLAAEVTHGPREMKRIAGAVAVLAVLLSPLVVQSTLVLDIDFALLLPLTLLFLVLYLRFEGQSGSRRWLWLAPLFCVLMWAKMTNPLPLIGVVAVWQALRGNFWRALVHLVVIGGGGIALFLATWAVIGSALGFPLDMPFGVNLAQWRDSADVARHAYISIGAFLEGLQPGVIWLGPGLVALGLVGSAVRIAQLISTWQFRRADLLIGLVGVLVLGYVNKSAGWFPKYQVALAPLLACIGAPLVAYAWCARPRLAMTFGVLAALAVAAVTLGLVRDDFALQRTWAVSPQAGLGLGAVLVVATVTGLYWRVPAFTAAAGLVGLAVGWSVAVDAVQFRASYQTDYWYGTTGTVEAAQWVDQHLGPDQTYVAAKEVAIRSTDQRYVDQDNFVYSLGRGQPFDGTWAGEPLRALVIWQREPHVAGLFERGLAASGFQAVARFGDYVVYGPVSS